MRISLALIIWCCTSFCQAQSSLKKEYAFIQHLERIEEWEEALLVLEGLRETDSHSNENDTLNFLLGKHYYKAKNVEQSINSFGLVSANNPTFYRSSTFFTAFQQAYLAQYKEASNTLTEYTPVDSIWVELKSLQMAGLALLERDFHGYQESRQGFKYAYQLDTYERSMDGHMKSIESFKPKSAFTAGLLSAVVPGAGRFYIGRPGEGVATLLVTGIFGLQAWEGYRKDGDRSLRFLLFGSAFAVTYVANIWGSVLAVKIRQDEFNAQTNASILLDMHVPLRVLLD